MTVRVLLCIVAAMWVGSLPARAQAGPSSTCDDALAAAERHYLDQAYDEVEPLVTTCVYRSDATTAHLRQSYRLLALAFIKQSQLTDAQLAVLRLLGADYAYQADPVNDPPFYVALVDAVKGQLRVADAPTARETTAESVAVNEEVVLVNLNDATLDELDTVPGIGPAIANRILAYRQQNGPFREVAALEAVSGIGPVTLARMAPYLTVSEATIVTLSGGGVAAEPAEIPVEPSSLPLINLNTATVEELDTLSGIGPALAARIVAYRTEYGPFQRVDDVTLVSGIGPATLAGFADLVTVE